MIIVNHCIVWSVAKLSELTLPCNTHLGGPLGSDEWAAAVVSSYCKITMTH